MFGFAFIAFIHEKYKISIRKQVECIVENLLSVKHAFIYNFMASIKQ